MVTENGYKRVISSVNIKMEQVIPGLSVIIMNNTEPCVDGTVAAPSVSYALATFSGGIIFLFMLVTAWLQQAGLLKRRALNIRSAEPV